jgi:hypothetical protein
MGGRATSAATSFFDRIAVGRYGEEFVDGATDANSPVREALDQAQIVWGPEPLEGRIKFPVSIGTGVPSLKPFKENGRRWTAVDELLSLQRSAEPGRHRARGGEEGQGDGATIRRYISSPEVRKQI